jgi:PhnB protein
MTNENKFPFFAPQLFIGNGVTDISFYKNAFGAVEQLRLNNDDGSLHVAELSIEGAIFHLHEITANPDFFSPEKHHGSTTLIGLFVENVDEVMTGAINAGAKEIKAAKDYEYGYRQGEIEDPFGHHWLIEKKIL